jgi:anti-sigma-K factor RskA
MVAPAAPSPRCGRASNAAWDRSAARRRSRSGWWERLGLWRSLAAGGFAAAAIMAVVVGTRLQDDARSRSTWWYWPRRRMPRLAGCSSW